MDKQLERGLQKAHGDGRMMGNIEYLLREYTLEEAAYLLEGARGYSWEWWLETLIMLSYPE